MPALIDKVSEDVARVIVAEASALSEPVPTSREEALELYAKWWRRGHYLFITSPAADEFHEEACQLSWERYKISIRK